jgi:hypothetical protein
VSGLSLTIASSISDRARHERLGVKPELYASHMNANVGVNDWLFVPIPFRCLGDGSKEGEIVVPTIVPAMRQNRASRANSSQLARSGKWQKRKDLRGKQRFAERPISV